MKNIIEILSELGITVPEDKHAALNKGVAENYKTIAEHEKKVNRLTEDLNAAKETLKGFEGIDPKDLQQKLDDANRKMQEMEDNHRKEAEEREFNGILQSAIAEAKGKNAKAITALLDMDKLRGSRNQQADIKAALDALRADSGYLFEDNGGKPQFTKPNSGGAPTPTGVTKEVFSKMSYRERLKIFNDNPTLYKELTK